MSRWSVNVLIRQELADEQWEALDNWVMEQEGRIGVSGSQHQEWVFPSKRGASRFARKVEDSMGLSATAPELVAQ